MGLGSDSTPVKVNLMGVDTYLADSMQFGLEYACRLADRGAFYIMPSFRGEDCDRTHLAQFFHSEAEIPGGLEDVMLVVERYIRSISAAILEKHSDGIQSMAGTVAHIQNLVGLSGRFPRITFDEAARYLSYDPQYVKQCVDNNYALTREGECKLMREISPVLWLTHFHHLSVPFYQAVDPNNERLALAADLLMGPGEIIGCGERHADGGSVLAALARHGVDAQQYDWYVRMKQEFPMKTSGFGLGIERYLMWVMAHDDIRDFQIMPRVNGVNIVP
jgi:asparaginyl-tRNA synthetase